MKIAVIGGDGRTGVAFVRAALIAGHEVTAGARHSERLASIPGLRAVHCEATSADDVRSLIEGQEVVVSLLGHVKGSAPDIQTIATRNLVGAMERSGLTRVVSLTGTGVRFPGDQITLADRILNMSISLIDAARVRDGQTHVEVLKRSQLDWTIIRVLKLQDLGSRPFKLAAAGPTKLYIDRRDVAVAILQVIEDGSFIRQAPIIAPASSSRR